MNLISYRLTNPKVIRLHKHFLAGGSEKNDPWKQEKKSKKLKKNRELLAGNQNFIQIASHQGSKSMTLMSRRSGV